MGSRTRDTLKEIDELRAHLDAQLSELEERVPGSALGRKALGLLLGGGAGSSVAMFAAKKLFKRGVAKRKKEKAPPPPPQVTVKVIPTGAIVGAVAIAALWAGVRVLEAKSRSENGARGGESQGFTNVLKSMRRGA